MKFRKFIEQLLSESNQSIANLGYPLVVASLLNQKFGKYAYTIAKWFRDYRYPKDPPANWWMQVTSDFRRSPSLYDLTYLYGATGNIEDYKKAINKLELSRDDDITEYDLIEQRTELKEQIKQELFSNIFFTYYKIIEDITSGKLKDIAPYKDLPFFAALHKYEEKNIFQDKTPIKSYKNGYRWIDVGKRCDLLGDLMRNCGSSGVMSGDEDRTILALFDSNNKPHAMVTYSPNEKRISGDEGMASTEVKSKYHRYILDLAKTLGVRFDAEKSKSTHLKMKYLLPNAKNLRQHPNGPLDKIFRFSMGNQKYVSNGQTVIPTDDLEKVQVALKANQLNLRYKDPNIIKTVLNWQNQDQLRNFGVRYTPLFAFSGTNSGQDTQT